MDIEEDEPMGIPEWVVTFGDMMSLLLTFFIMLVSLSEIKEEDQYQALVESMRQQFGYTQTIAALTPGETTPRESTSGLPTSMARAMKKDTHKGGVPDKAPHGDENRVRIVRNGDRTAIGSVIFFNPGTSALTQDAKTELSRLADQLRGKPQKIQVLGHTAPDIAARASSLEEISDIGYQRAIAVTAYLVQTEGLEAFRFRTGSAGDSEPMYDDGDPTKMNLNARVEVYLTDEDAIDLRGNKKR